jgi:hypothetical protein
LFAFIGSASAQREKRKVQILLELFFRVSSNIEHLLRAGEVPRMKRKSGLPDFSGYNIPKWGKNAQITTKLQIAVKYTNGRNIV